MQESAVFSLSPLNEERGDSRITENLADFHLSTIYPAHNCVESVLTNTLSHQDKSNSPFYMFEKEKKD